MFTGPIYMLSTVIHCPNSFHQILKNPAVASVSQPPPQSMHAGQTAGTSGPPPPDGPHSFTMGSRSSTGNFGAMGSNVSSQSPSGPQGNLPDANRPYATQSHGRSFSQGNMLSQQAPPPQQFSSRNSAQPAPRYGNTMSSQGPPQLGALPFQGSQPPPQSSTPPQAAPFQPPKDPRNSGPAYGGAPPPAYAPAPRNMPAPSKPVFGVSLNRLYERDGLAVPMVVYQCIQAVDLFGLGVEGIYRQSGSLNHINKLKGMFDAGKSNHQNLIYSHRH